MTTNNKIDLRTCVPGQEVELRDGTIVEYDSKFKCSTDYPHLVGGESYTHDGHYLVSKTEDSWDIVKIFPLEKPKPEIDLNTCVPGQKVRLRNGSAVEYKGPMNGKLYTHQLDDGAYKSNGSYWHDDRGSDLDVVEILPLKKSKLDIDLNTCVPGQKVKLRDGTIGTYNGLINENIVYTHSVDGYSYISDGSFWMEDDRTSNKDVVEILPIGDKPVTDLRTCVPGQKVMLRDGRIVPYKRTTDSAEYPHQFYGGGTYTDEGYYWLDKAKSDGDVMEILPVEEEPVKTAPEPTRSIIDQIDVSNPDHVSIIPQSNGVLISIKKGLTTISWRHYNS